MSLLRRYRTMDERHDTARPIGEGAFVAPCMTRAYERSGVCPAPYSPCQHPLTHLLHKLPRWKRANGRVKQVYTSDQVFYCLSLLSLLYAEWSAICRQPIHPSLTSARMSQSSRRRLDFALYIDAMQVSLDGTWANHKFISNILDIESTQYECKHFLFAL